MEFVGTLTVEITSSMSTAFNYLYTQFTELPPHEPLKIAQEPTYPLPTPNKKKLI